MPSAVSLSYLQSGCVSVSCSVPKRVPTVDLERFLAAIVGIAAEDSRARRPRHVAVLENSERHDVEKIPRRLATRVPKNKPAQLNDMDAAAAAEMLIYIPTHVY